MTCGLVPRYEPAHDGLKTLDNTMINLRHCSLHCSRALYLCLHSPADRAMQKPWRNDTHLRIARLVVAIHPVS